LVLSKEKKTIIGTYLRFIFRDGTYLRVKQISSLYYFIYFLFCKSNIF